MHKPLTLSELNQIIKNTIQTRFDQTYWIVAEISDINFNKNGHCYLELIEKKTDEDKIISKIRANIWSYALKMIKPYFEITTGQQLTSGLKVLINAGVEFHEIYGLSLNIINIDPNYTIGDLERRKKEIIKKLREEGVLEMNKEINMPLVPQKLAIISSATAAGFEDLINQLKNNQYGYKFHYKLFHAYMQGDKSEESIIKALEKIFEYEDFFDVVLIIRGGGSKSDLSCFNNYWLAYNIAQFPLPVITGIGHERDETIADMVANMNFKTPTAVAEFLIDKLNSFESTLNNNIAEIIGYAESVVKNNKTIYQNHANYIINKVSNITTEKKSELKLYEQMITKTSEDFLLKNSFYIARKTENMKNILKLSFNRSMQIFADYNRKIKHNTGKFITNSNFKLTLYNSRIEASDPKKIIKKGYSLTLIGNKPVKNIKTVKKGQQIKTILKDGNIISVVKNTEK